MNVWRIRSILLAFPIPKSCPPSRRATCAELLLTTALFSLSTSLLLFFHSHNPTQVTTDRWRYPSLPPQQLNAAWKLRHSKNRFVKIRISDNLKEKIERFSIKFFFSLQRWRLCNESFVSHYITYLTVIWNRKHFFYYMQRGKKNCFQKYQRTSLEGRQNHEGN